MQLEIEIRSDDASNDIYELRSLLQQDGVGINLTIREQPPQQGAMSLGLVEPIIKGTIEVLVGHSLPSLYELLIKPKITKWLEAKKKGKLEVLSTLKSDDTKIHFLENNTGRSEIFENLKYAIDIDHTRAILIGNSEFDGGFSPIPPVKGNLEDFYRLLTDKLHMGLPPENVTVVFNKTNTEIEETLLQQSRLPATETLIIYFSGHGHRTDVKKLYLVAKNSKRIDDYLLGGIDFDFVSNVILRNATAKQKILILDACHSGIATQGTDDMIGRMDIKGSYVLASSPGDEVSYFEKNSRNTYFTGILLDAFRQGIENTSEMIALEDLYEYSRDHLSEKNFPHPIYKNELNIPAANFFIARNPAFSFEKLKQLPGRLFDQGKFEEALYEYRLLLQRYPEDLELRKKAAECETNALFNRFVQDGDELFFHAKDYRAAGDKYKKALQIREDTLVRGKLSRCQDYLWNTDVEKKEVKQTPRVEEKKKETPIVVPVIEKKKDIVRDDAIKKPVQVVTNEKFTGVFISVAWLVFVLFFVFIKMNNGTPLNAFERAGIPAGVAGVALVAFKWTKLTITEMLLYAHGFFFCFFPLIAEWVDSRDNSNNGMLLLLFSCIGFTVLVLAKLNRFKLADLIIACLAVIYLSMLSFSSVFYVLFRSRYGDDNNATVTGFVVGLIAGVCGIVILSRRWKKLTSK